MMMRILKQDAARSLKQWDAIKKKNAKAEQAGGYWKSQRHLRFGDLWGVAQVLTWCIPGKRPLSSKRFSRSASETQKTGKRPVSELLPFENPARLAMCKRHVYGADSSEETDRIRIFFGTGDWRKGMNKRCNLQDKARIVTAFISTSCLLPNRIEHTTISEHLSRLEREVHARGQAGPPEQ